MKWYAYAKWVLERVESFAKSQRFNGEPVTAVSEAILATVEVA